MSEQIAKSIEVVDLTKEGSELSKLKEEIESLANIDISTEDFMVASVEIQKQLKLYGDRLMARSREDSVKLSTLKSMLNSLSEITELMTRLNQLNIHRLKVNTELN